MRNTAPTSRRLALISAVIALFATGLTARQPPTPGREQRGGQYRVGVDLVRLTVTARDEAGNIVHDLRPEEFRVLEDGVEQEIAHFGHHESPISVVVLFDKSGSMADEKLMHAKDAVVNFTRALHARDEVLVIAFSDGVDQLGQFGLDAKTIERETKRIRIESGTRLYDAVIEGASAVAKPDRKEKRAILLLTDGEDTASRGTLDDAVEAIRKAEVPVYAIGIELEGALPAPWGRGNSLWNRLGASRALDALKRLTDGTGGWTYPIVAAKRCKEVCLLVADELRNQYLLGYYPTHETRDGRWRTIMVRTTRPGVTLATRAGYYAAGFSPSGAAERTPAR